MNIKDIILIIVVTVTVMLSVKRESDFEKYEKIKIKNVPSIKPEYLPKEFSKKAYEIIDEFIRKTFECNKEILIYFDYRSGEVVDCIIGEFDNVSRNFVDGEMVGRHLCSIHNHPKDVFSPPSGKNFGILMRDFEDYELVVSVNELWILKAKGVNEQLNVDLKIASDLLFMASFEYCKMNFEDIDEINDKCDELYGKQLLKYINGKDIKNIKLYKKEYSAMDDVSTNSAKYNCRKRITDPVELKKIDERINNPYILTGKDLAYAFYQLAGIDIKYEEVFND